MSRGRPFTVFLLAAFIAACGGGPASTPQIVLNPQTNSVDVSGLPADRLRALAAATPADEQWQAILRVTVKASSESATDARPAVAGKYRVVGDVLRFTPLFPFDEGRQYDVVLDRSKLPGETAAVASISAVVGRPAVARTPTTVVTHLYPSGDVVPANQLRMYVHFSAPMDWRSGIDHVKLVDEHGQEVVDAFLPLDADFWNADRTRYTVFFDPGRVKRGILPNKQMGRALEAGRRYTLVVKKEWRDAHGQPLKEEFRHEFRAAPAIERPLTMASWTIETPTPGTRDALAVTFPEALDHGLLSRALGVSRDGKVFEGAASIAPGETRWEFTPREPWTNGEYQLVALSFLEDLAGNRIGRAFEVDNFERTDRSPEPERSTRTFQVAPRSASGATSRP